MDQQNGGKIYYYIVIIEFFIFVSTAILANAWLWMTTPQRQAVYFLYKGAKRTTVIITLLVLVESLCFYFYQKRGHICSLALQSKFIKICLGGLRAAVFILFIAYHILFRMYAVREGLTQGADEYMSYLRPGMIITLFPIIGIEAVFGVIKDYSVE